MTKNIFLFIGWAIVIILAIDVLGFVAWIASGQVPSDGFYIGTITTHVLRATL